MILGNNFVFVKIFSMVKSSWIGPKSPPQLSTHKYVFQRGRGVDNLIGSNQESSILDISIIANKLNFTTNMVFCRTWFIVLHSKFSLVFHYACAAFWKVKVCKAYQINGFCFAFSPTVMAKRDSSFKTGNALHISI